MNLHEVIETIKTWLKIVREKYRGQIDVEFLTECEDYLRCCIESRYYLAELVVEPEGFHPHRFVSFEALDKRKSHEQEPYFYYDDEDSSMEDILENLDKGMLYIVEG